MGSEALDLSEAPSSRQSLSEERSGQLGLAPPWKAFRNCLIISYISSFFDVFTRLLKHMRTIKNGRFNSLQRHFLHVFDIHFHAHWSMELQKTWELDWSLSFAISIHIRHCTRDIMKSDGQEPRRDSSFKDLLQCLGMVSGGGVSGGTAWECSWILRFEKETHFDHFGTRDVPKVAAAHDWTQAEPSLRVCGASSCYVYDGYTCLCDLMRKPPFSRLAHRTFARFPSKLTLARKNRGVCRYGYSERIYMVAVEEMILIHALIMI